MQLWTDYEDNASAGPFSLGKLLRSEGRNALFASTDASGSSVTIRLTEALNDEGELTSRWERVAVLKHEHLLRIASPGKTVIDGVPLAYLLIEPTDAVLSEILSERALTTEETIQIASAAAEALTALHAAGWVHEHLNEDNVLAVGETVKLRSDCVRECAGEFENDTEAARAALRQRDIHDLGLLLFRCLTLQRDPTHQIASGTLPAPFNRIIPNALNGTWDLPAVLRALPAKKPVATPAAEPQPTVAEIPAKPQPATVNPVAKPVIATPPAATAPVVTDIAAVKSNFRPRPAKPSTAASTATGLPVQQQLQYTPEPSSPRSEQYQAGLGEPPSADVTADQQIAAHLHRLTPDPRVITGVGSKLGSSMEKPAVRYGVGVAAVVLLGIMIHRWGEAPDAAAAAHQQQKTVVASQSAPSVTPATQAQNVANSVLTAAKGQPGWRVIAYTYNHEEQARAKVIALQRHHFSLQPQVFTPTGGAPYFVALGVPAGEEQANNILAKAHRAGLPKDTYIRNF